MWLLCSPHPLQRLFRVVLDECHYTKELNTAQTRACAGLQANLR